MSPTLLAFEVPLPVVVLGATTGVTYGLLSVGLLLVYRTNRIINFAHGEIGAFGAAVFSLVVVRWHVPYYAAVPVAFAAAGGSAALAEVAVVRRLRNAPPLMSIVATLGVGQFLLFFSAAINPQAFTGRLFPKPPGLPEFHLGALRVTQAYTGMLVFGPLLVIGLTLFLRRGRLGIALRCASSNPDAAVMAGISVGRMSTLAWGLAGVLSTFTAMLVLPAGTFTGGESFGPSLLLRALACAVIARMSVLPVALLAGITLGVVEQVLLWNNPTSSFVDVVLVVVIFVALLAQRDLTGRGATTGGWSAVHAWRPIPDALSRVPEVRYLGRAIAGGALIVGLALPLVVTNSAAVILATVLCFALVGLSITVVTGLAGQLSLGQFAIAGVGAAISYHVSSRTGNFALALLYAGSAGALVSVVVGLPSLRVKGLLLTVSTLGFAVVSGGWLLQRSWLLGRGVDPGRPIVFGYRLDTGRSYYLFVLAVFVIGMVLAHNIRRSGLGRLLVAVRDNEDNARAFSISAARLKLQGFMLGGFLAGLGGAAYGHLLPQVSSSAFLTRLSIDVVAMTVIGGIGLLAGPLIGAAYIVGVPAFVPLDSAGLAATHLGWLVLILYLPGGVGQGLEPVRERYLAWVAARRGIDQNGVVTDVAAPSLANLPRAALLRPPGTVLLEADGLRRSFGGIRAVDDVTLQVRTNEILGLIGPNGAGKTTTFELLSGFTQADAGTVAFAGEDITILPAEARAQRGIIRSFQDASLFPTLTVREAAMLAFERVAPTSSTRALLGLNGQDRRKDRAARELLGAMGLTRYLDTRIKDLSTGTRRIAEIACLLALEPVVLLLDEPSSGIAQRETEALGSLLRQLRDDLALTLVVIEHDMPLIMGLADRIVVMDAGSIIATGDPASVQADPKVVEAYLGGNIVAIERSGARNIHPAGTQEMP